MEKTVIWQKSMSIILFPRKRFYVCIFSVNLFIMNGIEAFGE